MGDKTTLEMARKELEELYLGIPDDSVNLSFQHFAQVEQQAIARLEKKRSSKTEPISEINPDKQLDQSQPSTLTKIPSLDFSLALEATSTHYHHHPPHVTGDTVDSPESLHGDPIDPKVSLAGRGRAQRHHRDHHHEASSTYTPRREVGFSVENRNSGMAYDDMSHVSGTSMDTRSTLPERGGRRRPGIPHSNICTVCSSYIYIFRHRCLVCGRVYCRECVRMGMGEMAEGRKCLECLGRKFSQRYIKRAGHIGCCMGYSSKVNQQELKWAEKGPNRSGQSTYGRSSMVSRSRSPMAPRTPTRAHSSCTTSNTPSFVMNSPLSAYSPTNHPLPL